MRATNSRSTVRIVVADDYQPVLREITDLLACEFEVAAAAGNGWSLVLSAREHSPDVIVTDIRMPGLDGITAARMLLQENVCRGAVVLTMFADHSLIEAAGNAGIRGYVLKENAGEDLIGAIHSVASGGWFVSSELRFPGTL